MKKVVKKKLTRRPSTPADVIRELFLGSNMTQAELAAKIFKVSQGRAKLTTVKTKLSEVMNNKRKVSAEFAYLLALALGTEAKMWLNLQMNVDLYEVEKSFEDVA